MVGLFQHLGRSVQNRPHFFIALIFWSDCCKFISMAHFMEMVYHFISKLEWLDQFIFTPCLETDEKCRPFTNATASQKQDESKWVIMLIVLLAITMSLVAILVQLSQLPSGHYEKLGHVALALLTIISAWLFMHTVFALHYAHDFYMALSRNEENGGLDFRVPNIRPTLTSYILAISLAPQHKPPMFQLPTNICVF